MVFDFLKSAGLKIDDLSAIAARAGATPPLEAGAYRVNRSMVDRLSHNPIADHPANLCAIIAYEIAQPLEIPVYIYDSGTVDQMDDVARISGLPELKRKSLGHAENMRAVAKEIALREGKAYEEMNIIVAHLGGGITLSIHRKGRMVDIISDDGGPFAPERTGILPSIDLVRLCYSGKYDQETLIKRIRGQGGVLAYLDTADALEVEERIRNNDKEAKRVYFAMAYQVAKAIGELATVVNGEVDRIVLTGGLARSDLFTGWIIKKVRFIAPVEIIPGEREMEALCLGALRVLQGIEKARAYDIE
jgi:butyrate kinase